MDDQIDVSMSPSLPHHKKTPPVIMKVFPDSGASICLASTAHLAAFKLTAEQLLPCSKTVTVVGGSTLLCSGWLPMTFRIGSHTTRQPLYFCAQANRIYLSRKGCTELSILPPSYPNPIPSSVRAVHAPTVPVRPEALPYTASENNVDKLKQFLIESFKDTAFNKSTPFPAMETTPVHIHLKPDAKPYAHHVPIPVPYHWKDQVKKDLDADVARKIIQPVPIGTPVEWCSKMLITAKKNGSPRRVVDYQKLNSQCLRETHHCPPPFSAASQVPANTKKSVFDAVDGYHSIPLDEQSQPMTTFITEWGRYQYLRLPQGFLAAGDAYTRRFDEIISSLPNKVKVVDDCLLYDNNIEESFYHAWDFLTICANNGIVLNIDKFQFCQDTVEFAGLQLTKEGILPSSKILTAIRDFPTPANITDARSWFGLVNQVAWAYSIGPVMEPFRELVKHNNKFHWDSTLNELFENSKSILIAKVAEGIYAFDPKRHTCLQPDWSKQGIGYLLLQKYCQCPLKNAPVCCHDGWHLVFAGSRCTQGAEVNYAPTEGEALAVAWSLEHAKHFVLGCPDFLVVTDHLPLLGILNDRDLNTITNPRIYKFKERTL